MQRNRHDIAEKSMPLIQVVHEESVDEQFCVGRSWSTRQRRDDDNDGDDGISVVSAKYLTKHSRRNYFIVIQYILEEMWSETCLTKYSRQKYVDQILVTKRFDQLFLTKMF